LRVELGDPPVVLAGRVGGDVGEGVGAGRPIELEDVEVGGREEERRGGLGRIDRDRGDALNLDVIFANDAGGQRLGGEWIGGAGGAFNVQESDALAIGREGGSVDFAVELTEAAGGLAVERREIEVRLPAGIGAVGEDGEGVGAGGPDEAGCIASLAEGRGHAPALVEGAERRDADHSVFKPGEKFAVGRDSDLRNRPAAVEGGENLAEAGGGGRGGGLLGRDGKGEGRKEGQGECGAMDAGHRGMLEEQGTREQEEREKGVASRE
jgi:hypothetical protein